MSWLPSVNEVALAMCVGAFAGFLSCTPLPPDPPPQPEPQGGAGPIVSDCAQAEAHLRALNCCMVDGYRYDTCPDDDSGFPLWEVPAVAGEPVKSFAEACEYSLDDGRDWCAGALAEIESCGEIDSALRSCK